MPDFIVVGKSERVVTAVLQSIRGFTDSKCIVIGNVETRGLRWSSLCGRHIFANFAGPEDAKIAQVINAISEKMPDVVVVPADCAGMRLIGRIRAQLRPQVAPIPELATLDLMDDKWQFHEFCRRNGLDVPTTYFVGSKDNFDIDAAVAKLGLPFVLKPANESGSLGVQIVRSKEHYLEAVERNDQYQFKTLIAQRYIDGEDIDLSLLSNHGRIAAFAIQQARGAMIEFIPNPCLENMAATLCEKSAYHGVMHLDARIEAATGRVFLIESNPRFWASLTAATWCGLNFVLESVRATARPDGPLRLTAGTAYARHPLLRPGAWSTLRESGTQGRLVRASTLDIYSLGKFAGELPVTACRYVGTRAVKGFQAFRSTKI